MEDLEQRRELKSMMTGLFTSLANYQEDMNEKLKNRVFSEIQISEEMRDIYVTVCSREEIDPLHEFLYPMIEEDLVNPIIDVKSTIMALCEEQNVFLCTLFLTCDFPMIQKLKALNPTFQGKMKTNKGVYNIEVTLKQSQKYIAEIEKLYHSFLKNDLPWKTVHHPYANKFFDVYLNQIDGELQEDEVIQEISVHLQEWNLYKRTNIIPLWNVQHLEISTTGFPFPALDRINFEHTISLQKYGSENGFLIDGEETNIRYVKRLPDSLVVVSPIEESKKWKVLKIVQPKEVNEESYPFKLVSNKKKGSFVNRYANLQLRSIRTKGEMFRLVDSFDASKGFKLVDFNFLDGKNESLTYDMNPFIIENIRMNEYKKILQLVFKCEIGDDFLMYDLMSFIVSEVQRAFPDYRCEGVFI